MIDWYSVINMDHGKCLKIAFLVPTQETIVSAPHVAWIVASILLQLHHLHPCKDGL